MKTFQLSAVLESYRSMKDRGLRVTFETGELSPEQVANIQYSFNKAGFLAFSPDPFRTQEMEEMDALKVEFEDTGKTQSQRIRNTLYLLWKQKDEGYKVFHDYYYAKTDKYIEHLKSKIEP